mmetsp:Transcript_6489/g.7047  ORF Transcript_6489/g.7047 Transcript_6489/m.7047 type:complete len:445 (-) Transcript_6489:64-1398(-)
MEEEYDVIVLGTGLTECVLSGLLSVDGKKVLHMDRNDYYGAECASLNLEQLFEHFKEEGKPPESFGRARDYNVDLIPKFLMANGTLVKILLHTQVTRYLEFKSVEGSYVVKGGKVHKVPATPVEAAKSSLLGLFEKNRFKNFLEWAVQYKQDEPKTHKGVNAAEVTCAVGLKKYKFSDSTMDFLGHALALYRDETWRENKLLDLLKRVNLYYESLTAYGKSPYLYPLYGLGDLPQAFARLAAIYGGTYMLNKPIEKIVCDDDGKVIGVQSEGEVAKCKAVIGDPSYFVDKVKKVGQVVRCICLLDHPIPNTNNSLSYQVILPQNQVNRKSDIYVSAVSYAHNVAPKSYFIALVSTTVETSEPHAELEPGLKLLGKVEKKFYSISDMYEPTNECEKEQIFISNSYDPTSHFETVSEDVLRIYKSYTGKDVDLTPKKKEGEDGAGQ